MYVYRSNHSATQPPQTNFKASHTLRHQPTHCLCSVLRMHTAISPGQRQSWTCMQMFPPPPSKKRSIHSQFRFILNTRLGSPSTGVPQFVKFLTTELKVKKSINIKLFWNLFHRKLLLLTTARLAQLDKLQTPARSTLRVFK